MLHENFIIHRAIQPENIVWEWRNDTPHIYLTDFAVSGYIPDEEHEAQEGEFSCCGYSPYMPHGDALGDKRHFPDEVWAVGVILVELVRNIDNEIFIFTEKHSNFILLKSC